MTSGVRLADWSLWLRVRHLIDETSIFDVLRKYTNRAITV